MAPIWIGSACSETGDRLMAAASWTALEFAAHLCRREIVALVLAPAHYRRCLAERAPMPTKDEPDCARKRRAKV